MTLTIISPQSSKRFLINWLDIETLRGSLVIQPGHAPEYIVLKKESDISWALATGAIEKIKVANGFLEVQRDRIMLICDRDHL